jgi:predicted helicase
MHVTATQRKAIDHYYKELDAYHNHKVTHEMAVRKAFQTLLDVFAQAANWTLILEQTLTNGKRPDGTLRDTFNLPRGYWEAKDTKDDLNIEIRKKINAGYPVSNTIFEDTRRAILYQSNKPVLEVDLTQPKDLTNVLDQFFHYAAPDIATFEHAVQDFKESIPDLAQGLLKNIKEEHARNKAFVSAFATFLGLCRTSLDPNMSSDTVNEMLVQHLLTERLFRTIFHNPDFTRRNVIAAEIEKVIQTLTSRAFNRSDFEKTTNRFYVAIENAARGLDDWAEKQHFLNTVYERFFQGFSIKQADTHGIVYTPQEIVDFMCASVDEVLRREFGTSIEEPGVQIIDPCVGTGSYIVNLLHRIPTFRMKHKYEHDLFCNEITLLPYYIASLNIEHEYYSRMGEYEPFDGICFTDTLELAESQQLSMFVEENTERIQREKDAQIMVVIGNPPYNMGQKNENDNNKNRRYPVVDERIRETYAKDSKAQLNNKLYDAYVRFFRWAVDRLQGRDGIVCFVSNNSFVDQFAFDGMRKHLLRDFTQIYHLDLHGNVRKNPKLSGTTHNVFGIQVGVGITIAIRATQNSKRDLYYYRVPEYWRKTEKLAFLAEKGSITTINWQELTPDKRYTWITEGLNAEFDTETFLPVGTKEAKTKHNQAQAIFTSYSLGVATNRDEWAYDFNGVRLAEKIQQLIRNYNSEVFRWSQEGIKSLPPLAQKDIAITYLDNFVNSDPTLLKWTDRLKETLYKQQMQKFEIDKIRNSLYRPFCKQFLYFDHLLNQRRYQQYLFFPISEAKNTVIIVGGYGRKLFTVLVSDSIPDLNFYADPAQCFPFYTYNEESSNRRENITDWVLAQFQAQYGPEVTKWDIFHYVYAMLHHPQYRKRYAENLKRDLPHIPLLHSKDTFLACVRIGRQLMDIHLHYEQAKEYPLQWVENREVPFSWRVEKMRLTQDKTAVIVNEGLTLSGVPQECFQYRLGNRSALDWVIDQYQVSEDKRSGIVSDPNNLDDEEYIVRLIGRVITVSVETVKLVEGLAREVTQEDWLVEMTDGSVKPSLAEPVD